MKKSIAVGLSILILMFIVGPFTVQAEEAVSYENLETYIQSEFEKTHIPGMSVEIVDANGVQLAETYGDCESIQSPFIVGSISKSFTAVAIMQLVERGKIDLESPFAAYLPGEAKADCKTTVKQLLSQTSGIGTYSTLESYVPSDAPAPYQYSNVNYGLLGKIIERISGMDYGSYIKENIFEPLGMTHSYVSLKAAKADGMVDGYRNYFGFMVKQDVPYPEKEIAGWLNLPSAYIISSAEDMGKYLQAYLNQGEGILTPESIQTMTTGQVDVQEGYQYGMGWGLVFRTGEMILTHGGNVENYTTYMQILPERGIGIIVLTNACDYFIANHMAVNLAYNIAYQLMGEETTDIDGGEYWRSHALIDGILLVLLLVSLLPLMTLKRWSRKKRGQMKALSTLFLILIHAVLPTLILTVIPLLGIPMSVVRSFVPDIFLVQVISSAILYLTGVIKIAVIISAHKRQNSRVGIERR